MRKYLILTFVCLLFVVDSKAQVEITSAGTSSAYTLNVPGVFPLRNGIQVTFKAHTTCTASATMNVSGTGALSIRKDGNTNVLSGGDIQTGQIVTLAYDGANWQMMSPVGNPVSVPATYWNLNGSDIYNTNIGEVGIGTVTPASKLDVSGDVNTDDVYKIDGVTFLDNRSASTLVGNTLNSSLSGQYNTFVGEGAGAGTTTPMRNTFVGRSAGNGNVTGADNTSLGAQAAWQANSSYNTSVGAYSNSALTSGGFNTSLGYGAGQSNTTGVNNTIIGANANVDVNNLQFATAIGAGATVGQSYSLVLGGTGANAVKVGIGTTTPAENLQISSTTNSNISLIGPASSSNKLYFGSSAFAYLGAVEYDNSTNSMNFWTNNTPNRIYIDNAGKVGIGNNAPSSALHVTGNARVTGLVGPGTVIADASGNLSVASGSTITGSGTNNYLARWTPSGSQLGIGLIYDNGTNLGIGTTSPTNILSFGNASDRKIWVEGSVGNTVGRALTISSGNSGLGFNNVNGGDMIIQAGVGTGTGSSSIIFQNGTTLGNSPTVQTMSTKMVILGNGNVGIGTTAPNSPLSVGASNQFQVDVNGNLIRINNVTLSWPAANGSGFLSNNGSGTLTWSTAGVLAGGTTNYVPKWTAANALSSTSLIFDNGTTVGINTAAPSAASKLHVVGAGNGSTLNVEDNSLSNGSVLYLSSTSAGGTASNNSRMITIARSGANTNASHTAYGLQSSITNTGTTSTNIAGYFSSTGATNNYAIIVPSSSGTVGIGTTAPDDILHVAEVTAVYDGSTGTYIDIQNSDGTANNGQLAGLRFRTDGVSAGANARFKGAVVFQKTGSWGVGDILFLNNSAGSNASVTTTDEKMRITSGGNVGIGTTTPGTSRLNVVVPSTDATNPVGLTVTNNYIGASTKYGIDVNVDGAGSGVKYGISSSVIGLAGDASSIYGYQVAMTPNGTGPSYGVYSNQSNVGTGTRYGIYNVVQNSATNTSPSYGSYNYVLKPSGSSGNIYGNYVLVSNSGTGNGYGVYVTGETYNYFSGTVGIGVALPTASLGLEVQKSSGGYVANFENLAGTVGDDGIQISIGNTLPNTTAFYVGCYAGGGLDGGLRADGAGGVALYTASDRRLKQNIVEIPDALNTLSKISAKQYEFIAAPGKKMHGFIAQELFEIYPEAVAAPENENDIYMVNYSALTPLLTGGINELYKLIKEQQAQLELLKKQIEEQKKQLEQLDKK